MEELGSDLLYPFPEEAEAKGKGSPIVALERLDRDQIIGDIAQILVEGGTIVYPTDTLYGIGAVPLKPEVYQKVSEIKGRPADQPFSLLVSDPQSIYQWAKVPPEAEKLIEKHWPGPVTIVLEATTNCPPYWMSQRHEVAFRHMGIDNINALVEAVGGVITTTSANLSGYPAARSVQDAYRYFDDKIDIYIDGGVVLGTPSTIVRFSENGEMTVIREGALTKEQVMATVLSN